MLRQATTYAILLLALGAFAGFAWLTRHPEAEILERAETWPGVGPLASRFRAAYLPPERRAPPVGEAGGGAGEPAAGTARRIEVVVVQRVDPDLVGARPYVWVEAGTRLHAAPDEASPVLHTETVIANLARLERRGDWFRVRRATPRGEPLIGWVHLEGYVEPTAEWLAAPAPVLPLPARPPDPDRLAAALALLDGAATRRAGPWVLHTDVRDEELLALLDRVAGQLEPLHRERYGLTPVSGAAEVVLLFASRQAFLAFRAGEANRPAAKHAYAVPARGYVALHAASGPSDLASTLVHELVHSLNRRALGPALPPWLEEGIADDLAESRLDAAGRLQPGLTSHEVERRGDRLVRSGGVVSALRLERAYEAGAAPPLPELLAMDAETFLADAGLHYAQSSSWVRFLLSGRQPGLAEGFRRFLAGIAAGGPATPEALADHLGRGWPELERDFRAWVRTQALPYEGEVLLAGDGG